MRILLLHDAANPANRGTDQFVFETCSSLESHGHAVALAHHVDLHSPASFPLFHVPERWPRRQRLQELQRAIETFKPDVLQIHSVRFLNFVAELSKLKPTCLFIHDPSFFCSGIGRFDRTGQPCHRAHDAGCLACHLTRGCGTWNVWSNLRRWQHVQQHLHVGSLPKLRLQVGSHFMAEGLLENRFPSERIDVIPPFAHSPLRAATVDPGRMLFVGPLRAGCGVDLALEAAAKLIDVHWNFDIVGEGPERARLQELSRRLGADKYVTFHGDLSAEALSECYGRAQFVVAPGLLPQPVEPSVLDALAHGRPVVTLGGGCLQEWLVPDESAIFVEKCTASALSTALSELLNNAARCRLMSAEARARAADFTPTVYVERLRASFEATMASY